MSTETGVMNSYLRFMNRRYKYIEKYHPGKLDKADEFYLKNFFPKFKNPGNYFREQERQRLKKKGIEISKYEKIWRQNA